MKMIPFQFEHLDLFAWRDEDYKTYNVGSELLEALRKAELDCWTVIGDGRILAFGGMIPRSSKTGYTFTALSKYATPAIGRLVKRQLQMMMRDMGLHRLVTYNRSEAKGHHRWCEWLGFRWECEVEKFDDEGNNYYQYGMVNHGS